MGCASSKEEGSATTTESQDAQLAGNSFNSTASSSTSPRSPAKRRRCFKSVVTAGDQDDPPECENISFSMSDTPSCDNNTSFQRQQQFATGGGGGALASPKSALRRGPSGSNQIEGGGNPLSPGSTHGGDFTSDSHSPNSHSLPRPPSFGESTEINGTTSPISTQHISSTFMTHSTDTEAVASGLGSGNSEQHQSLLKNAAHHFEHQCADNSIFGDMVVSTSTADCANGVASKQLGIFTQNIQDMPMEQLMKMTAESNGGGGGGGDHPKNATGAPFGDNGGALMFFPPPSSFSATTVGSNSNGGLLSPTKNNANGGGVRIGGVPLSPLETHAGHRDSFAAAAGNNSSGVLSPNSPGTLSPPATDGLSSPTGKNVSFHFESIEDALRAESRTHNEGLAMPIRSSMSPRSSSLSPHSRPADMLSNGI